MFERLLVLVVVIGSSCGGDDDTQPPKPGTIVERFADAWCAQISACAERSPSELLVAMLEAAPRGSCEAFYARYAHVVGHIRGMDPTVIQAAVEAGEVTFDEAALSACLGQIGTFCAGPMYPPEACRDVFEGREAVEGGCHYDWDCAGDAFCDGEDVTLDEVCGEGVCRLRGQLGDGCAEDDHCSNAEGPSICNFYGGGGLCTRLEFRTEAAVEEPCDLQYAPEKVVMVTCAAGLTCDKTTPNYTCQPFIPIEPELGNEVGASCGEGCNAFLDLICVDGICARWGDGSEGTVCDWLGRCNDGLYCRRYGDWTCVPQLPDGASCLSEDGENPIEEDGRECQSGTCECRAPCDEPSDWVCAATTPSV